MNTANRTPIAAASHPASDQKQLMDYVRLLYKRRWIAIPAFLIVFTMGAVSAMRQTPVYQAAVVLLIDSDTPKVAKLDQMFDSDSSYYSDEFRDTQFRILQSRTLAKRTIDDLHLWDAPRLGNGPEPKASFSITSLIGTVMSTAINLAKMPFADRTPRPSAAAAAAAEPMETKTGESAAQSGRIDEFLGGLSILPIRSSKLVEVHYSSTDPVFAAVAANAVVKAYIQQNMESKFTSSKDAADFLGDCLDEQKHALEASEAALQNYKEKNGTVSAADSSSNIVVQGLTDLSSALTKAKTERINKEALYDQLKSAETSGTLDTYPSVIANDYIQKLKADSGHAAAAGRRFAEVRRQESGHDQDSRHRRHSAGQVEQRVVESGRVGEERYQAALAEEQNLQSALDSKKAEALSQNRKGIESGVLQRDVDSNRQIYESLMKSTKETSISGELRASNVSVVDPAETPRGPISPNVPRDLMTSFAGSLAFALVLALFFETIDNRIRTPQELKTHLGVPFLGMVPSAGKQKDGLASPLLNGSVAPNFAEAFKTVRTNVLFSSAEDGLKSIVVTSAGPGEGKSTVAANLALALAQAGQRVLLIDADMRRPRVHDIFDIPQEPGLSNILTANAKVSETIRKSATHGLWLLSAGHTPPNPAELLGSRRYVDFIAALDEHFDWAIIDTPPVLAVADSTIAANDASGVVFVVGADKTNRGAARAAVEQLDSASAHLLGAVLNNVDFAAHPHYYPTYYRKEYAKYLRQQRELTSPLACSRETTCDAD